MLFVGLFVEKSVSEIHRRHWRFLIDGDEPKNGPMLAASYQKHILLAIDHNATGTCLFRFFSGAEISLQIDRVRQLVDGWFHGVQSDRVSVESGQEFEEMLHSAPSVVQL